jgi:tetratricopeptide (TPR) repeat protein
LPRFSAQLPSTSAQLPSLSGSQSSASLPQRSASLPAALGGLPSPGASPRPPSAGFSLTPPASLGDLELPLMPPLSTALDAPVILDEPVREPDPFGEAELPPPRSLRDAESKASLQPPAAAGNIVRQEGGGTSYGEVNLGGDSEELSLEGPSRVTADARGSEDMEFEAVPQEKGKSQVSDPRQLPQPQPQPQPQLAEQGARKRTGIKVFAGICVALASGGALALDPDIGPFGAHWIVDQARAGEYDVLIRDTTQRARRRFGADTAPEATRAWNDADQARASAKRLKPLSTHAAFVGYLRELRFGSAPEIHARAGVLLDEIDAEANVPYYALARAARAATEGQLARARQSLVALLASERNNVDALVVSGEVELRARDTKAALEAWDAVAKLERSARAVFGLARAQYWAGDVANAEVHAKETLAKNPSHVGARILLARIASVRNQQELSIQALESVTQERALASAEELVNAYTLLGDVHLSRSRISRAEGAYGAALKLDPKAPGALSGLGEALFRAGRYSEAQARFEASAQADPDDLAAKVGVAKSKLLLERLDEAKDSLTKLREAHPKSVLAAYWHGRVLEALGEREPAATAYRTAIEQKVETDPMLVEAYVALALLENQQGKAEAALATLNAARKRFPRTPAIHRALGEVALTQGRYVEAKSEFEQALALNADDLATRFRLGTALRRDGKFDEAVKVFDDVAAVDAEFPGLALERGLLFEAAGKTEEALKQYEGARAKAPDDPDLLLRVGCGYASAGRTKEAEELLRKVLALRPTSAETQHCLGRALLAEGSRLADALRLLERAAELDPHRAEYYLYVGWAANEAGNVAKAQRALDEAIKLDQGLADAYWQRGVLRSRQGAVKDAVSDLTRALVLRPTRYEAHAALADAYYDLGREPLALEEWGKAVRAKSDNATWRFRYGKLLAANHRSEAAKVELSRALELAEQNPKGERWLWEAHHLLARVLGPRPESVPHWEAFLKLGPLDSPYRAEAKAILERLGRPWTGN